MGRSHSRRQPNGGLKKTRRKRKKRFIHGPPIQYHHAIYPDDLENGEIVGVTAGHLFKGEHGIITSLRRQTRNVSAWFMECLEAWIHETCKHMVLRDLNTEITDLPEGQSWHCKHCGVGFLVKKNRCIHEKLCSQKDDSGGRFGSNGTLLQTLE